MIGPPRTGKSHTLIGLGHAAVTPGLKVKYCTAADLIEQHYRGPADDSVGRIIDITQEPTEISLQQIGREVTRL